MSTPVSLTRGPIKATYDYTELGYDGLRVKDTGVDIYDGDAPTVIIQQARGSTDVIEGDLVGDTYSIVLSKKPAAGKTVTVKIDSIDTRTTVGINTYFQQQVKVNGVLTTSVTFDEFNWNQPVDVTVTAIDDTIIDGSDTQVFAPQLHTVNRIRGPIDIEGAAGGGSLSLP